MMKNNIISFFIFIIVLIFVVFAHFKLINMFTKIEDTCNLIEDNIESKNYNLAYTNTINLLGLLEDDNFVNSVYTTHSDLDEIINNSISIAVSIKTKEYTTALDTLHILKFSTKSLKKLQFLTLENIL